jgi:hypothetical protein
MTQFSGRMVPKVVQVFWAAMELWRYRDDPDSFSDSTTIHPDHYAARVTARATRDARDWVWIVPRRRGVSLG